MVSHETILSQHVRFKHIVISRCRKDHFIRYFFIRLITFFFLLNENFIKKKKERKKTKALKLLKLPLQQYYHGALRV